MHENIRHKNLCSFAVESTTRPSAPPNCRTLTIQAPHVPPQVDNTIGILCVLVAMTFTGAKFRSSFCCLINGIAIANCVCTFCELGLFSCVLCGEGWERA
eukprot:5692143-Amphidinium_carterae.1